MENHNTSIGTSERDLVNSSLPQHAFTAPLSGIERIMADAFIALGTPPWQAPSDLGAIEYASWIRLLRRTTP